MSTYMKAREAITCFPEMDCFRPCMENLVTTSSSGGYTKDFGPAFDVADDAFLRSCSCSTFRVYNAPFITGNSVAGSSATFSQASLTGLPELVQFKAQYIGRSGQGSCEITYLQTSGPNILGVYHTPIDTDTAATGLGSWLVPVIGAVVIVCIFCAIGIYCGHFRSCLGMRRTAGQMTSYPGNGQTGSASVTAFASGGHVNSTKTNGGNVSNIPVATVVSAADATGEIPVATEATPGIVRSSLQNDGPKVEAV